MKMLHTVFLTGYLTAIGYILLTGDYRLLGSLVFVLLLHIGLTIAHLTDPDS